MISNPEFYTQSNQKDDSARHTSILRRLLRGIGPKLRSGEEGVSHGCRNRRSILEGEMDRARVMVGAVHRCEDAQPSLGSEAL